MQEAYAAEAETRESLIDRACEPRNWAEWVVDLLVSPSCISPDPQELISPGALEKRIQDVISRIEKEAGIALDAETRQNISADVKQICGLGTPE